MGGASGLMKTYLLKFIRVKPVSCIPAGRNVSLDVIQMLMFVRYFSMYSCDILLDIRKYLKGFRMKYVILYLDIFIYLYCVRMKDLGKVRKGFAFRLRVAA